LGSRIAFAGAVRPNERVRRWRCRRGSDGYTQIRDHGLVTAVWRQVGLKAEQLGDTRTSSALRIAQRLRRDLLCALDVTLEVRRNGLRVSGVTQSAGDSGLQREDRDQSGREGTNDEWKNSNDDEQFDERESILATATAAGRIRGPPSFPRHRSLLGSRTESICH
jgi:hypothetical protein